MTTTQRNHDGGEVESPNSKKQKIEKGEHVIEIASSAWGHYRNYLDSTEGGNEEGDVDELTELLDLLKPLLGADSSLPTIGNDVSSMVAHYKTIDSLLPVLCSVAHYHLADYAISQTVDTDEAQNVEIQNEALTHLQSSLAYFNSNAASWSMGANYGRMTKRVSPSVVCKWYIKASECASNVRLSALRLLEGPDAVEDSLKEWVELLLLDHVVGAEYIGDEDGSEEGEEEEEGGSEQEDEKEDGEEGDEVVTGNFSASRVESISRFMASMLLSTAGQHVDALDHLKEFDLTHRLHPNVWDGVVSQKKLNSSASQFEPLSYPRGVLPTSLYKRLCETFAPNANYWKESDYAHRGYYSYFFDITSNNRPSNLIEDVITGHLLPLAKKALGEKEKSSIVGAEWWVHTRPIQANLGHNMHFDTDESLLAQEGTITHPIVSSVMYLTGNEGDSGDTTFPAGATIVLDQTPESEKAAELSWRSVPRDNTLMVFPGNLLHGVLPCPGADVEDDMDSKDPVVFEWNSPPAELTPPKHRLTFMVGFWTRNVPEKMKERHVYGPCGPMPPATEEHTWVRNAAKGYGGDNCIRDMKDINDSETSQQNSIPLPLVSPVWEEIQSKKSPDSDSDEPILEITSVAQSIDHRFFVKGAPQCFRESLFHDDCDDG